MLPLYHNPLYEMKDAFKAERDTGDKPSRVMKPITGDVSIQIDQLEKIYFTLKAIDVHTRPQKKGKMVVCYTMCAMMGLCFAVMLSSTMLYILWIGFYNPSNMFKSLFFMDRLYDFRELLQGLRDGSILEAFCRILVYTAKKVVKDETHDMHDMMQISDILDK